MFACELFLVDVFNLRATMCSNEKLVLISILHFIMLAASMYIHIG